MEKRARRNGKVASDKSDLVKRLPLACQDEGAAVAFLEEQRWGKEPYCPRCGVFEAVMLKDRKTGNRNRRYLWRCGACRKQFTVRIGTVFEDSRIPLKHWCLGFWLACASKKGVSALQIKRLTGLNYRSALFMMHRIRFAMADSAPVNGKLGGPGKYVEADETYVGGRERKGKRGRGTNKTPVFAMVERHGNVRAMPIDRVTGKNIKQAIHEHVDPRSALITDDFSSYPAIGREFEGGHHAINHTRKEYVRGFVYTNTVEGFFALLKRGIMGTFHSVSKQHLHRYVSEFEYRWNTRKMDDGERTALAIRRAEGKRLVYENN